MPCVKTRAWLLVLVHLLRFEFIVRQGDLVKPRHNNVRVYTDEHCETWEGYMHGTRFGLVISETQNAYKQDVLTVLIAGDYRWLYKTDVELLNASR